MRPQQNTINIIKTFDRTVEEQYEGNQGRTNYSTKDILTQERIEQQPITKAA